MAASKRPARNRRHGKRAGSKRRTSAPGVRRVGTSNAATTDEAARRLGVTAETVRRRIRSGALAAVVDASGHYHVAAGSLPAPPKKRKKRPRLQKKKAARPSRHVARPAAVASKTPAPVASSPPRKKVSRPAKKSKAPRGGKKLPPRGKRPAPQPAPPPAPPRKKRPVGKLGKKRRSKVPPRKKRPIAAAAPPPPSALPTPAALPAPPARPAPPEPIRGKKLVRRKKKKTGRRPTPAEVSAAIDAILRAEGAATVFGTPEPPPPPPPDVSAISPLAEDIARQQVGQAMSEFVWSRLKWERELTGARFKLYKESFRKTYGEAAWRRAYDWIVDEWELADLIFDYDALRDS